MTFEIYQDHAFMASQEDLHAAVKLAEGLFNLASAQSVDRTCSVRNRDGNTVAAVTNRRIVGELLKQRWEGDDAIEVAREEFDATNAVLMLPHKVLVALEDCQPSTDALGADHIAWAGPIEVEITDSICEFFGVDDLRDITDDALVFARERFKPQAPIERTVTITVKVDVKATSEEALQALLAEMHHSVRSQTVGAIVTGTELIDVEVAEPALPRP